MHVSGDQVELVPLSSVFPSPSLVRVFVRVRGFGGYPRTRTRDGGGKTKDESPLAQLPQFWGVGSILSRTYERKLALHLGNYHGDPEALRQT